MLEDAWEQIVALVESQLIAVPPENGLAVVYNILNFVLQLLAGPFGGGLNINLPSF